MSGEIVLYQRDDGTPAVELLASKAVVRNFRTTARQRGLAEAATCRDFRQVRLDDDHANKTSGAVRMATVRDFRTVREGGSRSALRAVAHWARPNESGWSTE